MKLLLTIGLLFFALVSGVHAQTGTATGMSVTSPQGNTKPLGQWVAGWNVIYPTNTSVDAAAIQNAVNSSQPVLMAPGFWQVCSQITLPPNRRLEGLYTLSYPGSNGPSTNNSKTIVSCPNNGTFTSGQAFFALQDHDEVRGLDIYCNFGSNPPHNNINALNAVSVEIDHNNLYWCHAGVSRFSDSTKPGSSASFSQLAHIHDNLFYGQTAYGIYANFANGGFVSDEMYGPNNNFVVINGPGIYANFLASLQIVNDRFEDSGFGIQLENSGKVAIAGNLCDQIGCLLLNNNNNIAVSGNSGNYANFGGVTDVEFAGNNSNIQFSGNAWGGAPNYTVDPGATLTASSINESSAASTDTATLFKDSYTQAILQPIMGANNASVARLATNLSLVSQNPGGHIATRAFSPTVSSCGTNPPSPTGDDNGATVVTGTVAPTACTLTFGVPYTYTPQCSLTPGFTTPAVSISAISTTALTMTFGSGLTSGTIYVHCSEPVANKAPIGVGMTTGWGTTNSTLTTAAGTDPLGGSTAAKLTVDNQNNRHRTSVAVSGTAGTSTISAYFHAGTSGSLNPVLVLYDAGFTNTIGAVISMTDGSLVGSTQQAGGGSIISTNSQFVGNGWWRFWMTFTLGAAVPVFMEIQLANGSSNFFTGNSADNLLMWGPALRTGTLP